MKCLTHVTCLLGKTERDICCLLHTIFLLVDRKVIKPGSITLSEEASPIGVEFNIKLIKIVMDFWVKSVIVAHIACRLKNFSMP